MNHFQHHVHYHSLPWLASYMSLGALSEMRTIRRLALISFLSMSALAIWHSLRELVSCPEVWLAQCLCESNESLPYRKLVESAKAEEQRIRIRTSQTITKAPAREAQRRRAIRRSSDIVTPSGNW